LIKLFENYLIFEEIRSKTKVFDQIQIFKKNFGIERVCKSL